MSERIPTNREAEESILGAMLCSSAAIPIAQETLVAEDFYRDQHRIIYRTLLDLYALGEPPDHLVLVEKLKREGQLERVGDREYLIRLEDTCPNPYNAVHYAKLVKEASLRRQLSDAGYKIAVAGKADNEDVRQSFDAAEQALYEISRNLYRDSVSHISTPIQASRDRSDAAEARGMIVTGIPTGFDMLDKYTLGLQPSTMVVVGGRTSMGKTSFALNIAQHAARRKYGVLIFSLEMSKTDIAERLLLTTARVDAGAYRTGRMSTYQHRLVDEAQERLSDLPIYVDDRGDITLLEMRTIARGLISSDNISMVVVDYLQLLYSDKRTESRAQEVSRLARDLKLMSMDLGITVVALSQLRRPSTSSSNKAPTLEDLKESGGIEQNADLVVLLYRPEMDDPEKGKGIADVTVAKNRTGRTGKFRLAWRGEYSTFLNPGEDVEQMEMEVAG